MRTQLHVALIALALSASTASAEDKPADGKRLEQYFAEQLNIAFEKQWPVEVFLLNAPQQRQPFSGVVEQQVQDDILVLLDGSRRYVHLPVNQIQVLIVRRIDREPVGTKLSGADGPVRTSRANIELRRAESAPGEGLTEAVVGDTTEKVYLYKNAELATADIAEARVAERAFAPDSAAIEITFTNEGSAKAKAISKDWINRPVALLVDGKIVSAPNGT